MEAMVHGSFMSLLSKYIADPTLVDIRKYITVSREELHHYIGVTPLALTEVLNRAQCDATSHDRFCIEQQDGKYFLYWLDHGQKRFGEEYSSLESVLVEYLLREHGLN